MYGIRRRMVCTANIDKLLRMRWARGFPQSFTTISDPASQATQSRGTNGLAGIHGEIAPPPPPGVQRTKSSKNTVRTGVFVRHAVRCRINSMPTPGPYCIRSQRITVRTELFFGQGSHWKRGGGGVSSRSRRPRHAVSDSTDNLRQDTVYSGRVMRRICIGTFQRMSVL